MTGFAPIEPTPKSGDEHFHLGGEKSKNQLIDYWRWHASDLVTNSSRGVLAEFIVAMALGVSDSVRVNWDAYDLVAKNGMRVEVKSASYLQTWYHKELSVIRFGIQPTKSWDPKTNILSEEKRRQADLYVFCLLHHKDQESLDPMDLSQWTFFVISASILNQKFPKQKSIGLSSLKREGIDGVSFSALADTINKQAEPDALP